VKVSDDKGVANHIGPEPCVTGSNARGEALVGERAGRVLSLEIRIKNGAPTRSNAREGNTVRAKARARSRLCGVRDPRHAGKHLEQELGEPWLARAERKAGCIGKSEDASQ
jgi:hypothetical protein